MEPGQTKRGVPAEADLSTKEDVALGITFQTGVDEKRQLVMQTYIRRDASPQEINEVLDKVVRASDRIDMTYRRRALEKELNALKDTLAKHYDDFAKTEQTWSKEWQDRGKKGPVALTGSQASLKQQAQVLQNRHRDEITRLESELETVNRRLKE